MQSFPLTTYQIGIICALPKELKAVKALFEGVQHKPLDSKDVHDHNSYALGTIGKHNVVAAGLPSGVYGTTSAASVSKDMRRTFSELRFGLFVGIGGGIPDLQANKDIRLGDVVVGQPDGLHGGVVQYDLGKLLANGHFERKGTLNKPPQTLLTALTDLQSDLREDVLTTYLHEIYAKHPALRKEGYYHQGVEKDNLYCSDCDSSKPSQPSCTNCVDGKIVRPKRLETAPVIHYGIIASGNTLLRNVAGRNQLARDLEAVCVEMEAAGLDDFPCLVIRGICDYADAHKNHVWQEYAALTAAVFAKHLLSFITPQAVRQEKTILAILGPIDRTLKESVHVSREILNENRIQSRQSNTQRQIEDERKCLQVFKTSNYEQYKDINPNRAAGTCGWALTHPHFRAWYNNPHDDLLWISADPGCGKSVLSRSLIEHELAALQQTTRCYYFFKDNERQDRLAPALCAILHQLFSNQPHLLKHAISRWKSNGTKLQEECGQLWQILLNAVSDRGAHAVVCVFDALDECRDEDRRELITRLCGFRRKSLTTKNSATIKFLVTSRPYDNVQRWFERTVSELPHIRLQGEVENDQIHDEINIVIDQRLEHLALEFLLSIQHQIKLRQRLRNMKHRTYLWLHLAMEEIRDKYRDSLNPEDVVINEVSTSVENAYENLLQKINADQRPIARRILLIIVGSRRPLTIGEVGVALNAASAYEKDGSFIEDSNVPHLERRIREWCGLFVFVNHFQLFLIHQTAKEFLLGEFQSDEARISLWKGSLSPEQVERELAIMCITYLRLSAKPQRVSGPACSDVRARETFFRYCAEHWTSHLSDDGIKEERKLLENVLKLYNTNDKLFDGWFRIFWQLSFKVKMEVPRVSDQHVIAMNGHAVVLAERYEREAFDLDERDSFGGSALQWASYAGHSNVVRFLLDKSADTNPIPRNTWQTSLHAAAGKGHERIVQMLLNAGADVNVKDEFARTPLQKAARIGCEKVVQTLIDRGADINAIGPFGTALHEAAGRGNEKVMHILIDKGADINAIGECGTALQMASEVGCEQVVQVLLNNGANINALGPRGTALQRALKNGHEDIVQILIDRGANVNAKYEYCTVL